MPLCSLVFAVAVAAAGQPAGIRAGGQPAQLDIRAAGDNSVRVTLKPATIAYVAGSGVLPDGNYRAVLSAAGVANENGTPMAADHVLEFFVLAGDVHLDRSVKGSDFAILAGNFGKSLAAPVSVAGHAAVTIAHPTYASTPALPRRTAAERPKQAVKSARREMAPQRRAVPQVDARRRLTALD